MPSLPPQTSNKNEYDDDEEEDAAPPALDEGDIALLKTYGMGPYTARIKDMEKEIELSKEKVKELIGITGQCAGSYAMNDNLMQSMTLPS